MGVHTVRLGGDQNAASTPTCCRRACWTLAHIMTWLGPGGYCRGGRVHDDVVLLRHVTGTSS
jgi:hypothetical protein